jgi:hypothetical protein
MHAFILDSGVSRHLTGNRQLFDDHGSFVDSINSLCVGNAYRMEIAGMGSITRGGITLPGVLYVPALSVSVVSTSQLADMDYKVEFTRHGFLVKETLGDEVVGRGTRVDTGLYMVDSLQVPHGRSRLPDYESFEAAMMRQ